MFNLVVRKVAGRLLKVKSILLEPEVKNEIKLFRTHLLTAKMKYFRTFMKNGISSFGDVL
jgi:hypothetical protein